MTLARTLSIVATLLSIAPASRAAETAARSPFSLREISVPFTVGVTHPFEIEALNDELRAADSATFSPLLSNISGSLTARLESDLILEPQYRVTIASTDEASLVSQQGLINIGYLLLERGDVRLHPVLGLGFAAMSLDFGSDDLEPERFGDVLKNPRGDALLTSWAFVAHGGIAADIWSSGHGDFLGLRTGVLVAPGTAGWKRRGVSVLGGPSPPVSAAYFAVAFGFRIPSER